MNMTFEERCRLSERCVPVSEYRTRLAGLHKDMLGRIKELEDKLKDQSSVAGACRHPQSFQGSCLSCGASVD